MTRAAVPPSAPLTGLPFAPLAPGSPLADGGYTIGRMIARGGFACVYRGVDKAGRTVAIKEFFRDDCCTRQADGSVGVIRHRHALHQRLHRSSRAQAACLAGLDHPNIIRCLDWFEERGTVYAVLEFFPGADLQDLLAHHAEWLQPPQVVALGRALADTLAHLHAHGILHGDLSPDNILLRDAATPVLIDIGADQPQPLRAVKDGYAAPELYQERARPTVASDIYALGATLHHLVAGHAPPTAPARIAAQVAGGVDPGALPDAWDAAYPPGFAAALRRAVALTPEQRFASVADFAACLCPPAGTAPGRMFQTAPQPQPQSQPSASAAKSPSLMPTLTQFRGANRRRAAPGDRTRKRRN